MELQCMGAAKTVTGSRHLLRANGIQILLDCGLFQDRESIKAGKNEHFGFDPRSIDAVILSHAHIDHSGALPRLVKEGFRGPIYCTPATKDLCEIMLADSARIQENDAYHRNKRRKLQGKNEIPPLYDEDDVLETIRLMEVVEYNEWFVLVKGIKFEFTDAGHILGSAAIHLEINEDGSHKHFTFTGDIGRATDVLLRSPQPFPQADFILCESTYGDRLHEKEIDPSAQLLKVVEDTCVKRLGKVYIPAFSLGRTQEIVYALNNLKNQGLLPNIPVYVDSPLSTNATEIMRKHADNFNADVTRSLHADPDPFGFNGLVYITDSEISKALNSDETPCVIISASGMLEAGRIKHHVRNGIEDPRNTILMVGYCAPGSLGADIMEGKEEVRIYGHQYKVNAKVEIITSYSAHGDYKEMTDYLSCQDPEKVKEIFLVHGEMMAQLRFKEHLEKQGFQNVTIPEHGQVFRL
jgi:metallo-beta-lactamase family protein